MNERIAQLIVAMCRERGLARSICPSEVARALSSDETAWRSMMPDVRAVASQLAARGEIIVTQRGSPVDIETARGPVRLRLRLKQGT